MIVIFSSMTFDDANTRLQVDADMDEWLAATVHEREGASIYKYMTDPSDPTKAYVFQSWPDDEAFATWSQQPSFTSLLEKIRQDGFFTEVSAVIFEGCTGTRGGPL
jgi:quinol monooxygenase YgiN